MYTVGRNDPCSVIIVMGATGTGKSMLIQTLTNDRDIRVGHKPESETFDVNTSQYLDDATGLSVILVDTPGFDDSRHGVTDTDALRKIANFLQENGGRKLNGLIYMHRISDPRFGAMAKKNLRMFRELCGDNILGSVQIVTSNWDRVGDQEGREREAALAKGVFKPFIDAGAILVRHDKGLESARLIVSQLIRKQPMMTRFQGELSAGKALGDTSVGAVVIEDIKALQQKNEKEMTSLRKELEEATKARQGALRAEIAMQRRALEKKISRVEDDHRKLQMTIEEERRERDGVTAKHKFQYVHSELYPPHLKNIPREERKGSLEIFNFKSLAETTALLYIKPDLLFSTILSLAPDSSSVNSMQDLVNHNLRLHKESRAKFSSESSPLSMRDMYFSKNIGLRDDWYSDTAFGQQQFTGPNPTTIKLAPRQWIGEFMTASRTQRRTDVTELLQDKPESIFVQDYSYFRSAMGLSPEAEFASEARYSCASVTLFHLEKDGRLHPLAVILDYKVSVAQSVTIFNRRIRSSMPGDESEDWPWRYAKMCAQVSDWFSHEIIIHLLNTHFVEEVIIVAAQRTLDPHHIVFKLLEPHWSTTLSLNKSARETLIPKIINTMIGLTPTQLYAGIKDSYKRFDWTGSYVPNDLRSRGFPIEDLDQPKYHNYGYARNISCMWGIIRKFVSTVLTEAYMGGDAQVEKDLVVASFCREVRSSTGGQLPSFPDIRTLDELIDAVTMCIHIASPQHTAVNYPQQYYLTFVPNKPSALYTRLPQSLAELERYGEQDILAALPIRHPRDWLIMGQVPYLLSFEVSEDSTIIHYATATSESNSTLEIIRTAARVLKDDLDVFASTVSRFSQELDDQRTPYLILDPRKTAISVLL